ncbi:MAG TPA: amino acid adenylation domain-containing protein, partial [Pyrinomonadaceae bacterium]
MSGTDISIRKSKLSAAKRALLEKRLRGKPTTTMAASQQPGEEEVVPQRVERVFAPLSFAQQRLWFIDQLEPGNPAYNIPSALRLTGQLNIAVLERSINEIIRRHESLRTTFTAVNGEPVQSIAPALNLTVEMVDLRRGLTKSERETEAMRLAGQEAQARFDLGRGPLLRATLLRLDAAEYVLLFTMHHIISDGWSVGVLVEELITLYEAYSAGKPPPLPELHVQYADFARWQRQWLQGEVLEAQLAYWKEQLGRDLPVLQLPTDKARPSVQSFRGASRSFSLSQLLGDSLNALSRREGVTLFMTLLTAFQTLLFRYTEQTDIVTGSPIANRNRSEIENLIGFFVNNLVLRTDLSGNPTFRELLRRVREVALAAYAHQDLPFEKLVEELHPERDLSRNPLFQIVFALQNTPMRELKLPGLTISPLEFENQTTRFDLEMHLWEDTDGFRGLLFYSTDLFEDATITRMIGHFQTLLESIVANPDERLTDLPLLTATEQQRLLRVGSNDTGKDYPLDRCVHQLFEAQVERHPEKVAVTFADRQLTYQELNRRANQLAHHLRALGVGPEVPVCICVERSLEMLVGLVGILKAGGAYVPLDPMSPPERLAFMLEDTRAKVLITQERLAAGLPEHCTQEVIRLDADGERIARESEKNPANKTAAENLVYIIYTSGSTGRPNGVGVTHSALLNLIFWHREAFNVTARDRATQIANVAFDACAWEIWPYLSIGASIHLPDDEMRAAPAELQDWLSSRAITITFLPTPLAERMLTRAWPRDSELRFLLTGGDQLHQYPSSLLPFELVNNYGPTENCVVTTSGAVSAREQATTIAPSIGQPITNTQVYILDQHLQPVPVGVPGQLCIGGHSLARGYLNRPELTASRFLPH